MLNKGKSSFKQWQKSSVKKEVLFMSRAQAATIIQKHVRGFLARKYYRQMLLDKRFQEQEELFYKESALLTVKKDSFMDFSIHNRSHSSFTIPMGYKHQVAALSIQKYLRAFLARGLVKREFQLKGSIKYKRVAKSGKSPAFESNPYENKPSAYGEKRFEQFGKIQVSKRLYQKALISLKEESPPTFISPLDKKSPLAEPFKTDFSRSIFDTSRKLQRIKQQEQRPQSVLYTSSSIILHPTEGSLQSAKQMLQFSPKSQILKKPVLYEFDLYLRAAKEIQRVYRGWRVRKRFQLMRQSAVIIQNRYRKYLTAKREREQRYLQFMKAQSKIIIKDFRESQAHSRKQGLNFTSSHYTPILVFAFSSPSPLSLKFLG